jgi:hypothetical protein
MLGGIKAAFLSDSCAMDSIAFALRLSLSISRFIIGCFPSAFHDNKGEQSHPCKWWKKMRWASTYEGNAGTNNPPRGLMTAIDASIPVSERRAQRQQIQMSE